MVRTFPILFMYEINGEEHKLICNRQGSTFTVYIDDEKATSFQKKNFYLNSEHIFNFKGHEYCLFFYSEKLYLINSPAMLVIDGVRTEKHCDGKYRLESSYPNRKQAYKYSYMPDKDPLTIIIAIITVLAYIAAIIIYPPYKDMNFFITDTFRVFGALYVMAGLIGYYRLPFLGISKHVKFSFKEKILYIPLSIILRLLPLIYITIFSFAGVVTALQK